MTLKLIGYVRISTESQVGNTSIPHQKKQIQKFCEDRGYELLGIFEEQGSAENMMDRPVWLGVQFQVLNRGDIDGIVCFNQSRVSRNTGELCQFADSLLAAKKTIKIVSDPNLDLTQSGDYFKFTIISAMDRKDRIDTINKMQEGRAAKAQSGGYAYGAPRFGTQTINGELVAKPSELETIEIIRRHRQSGKSWSAIAEYLNAHGYPTKRGGQWSHSTVQRVHVRLKSAA